MENVRSITPLPPANFTPEMGNYKTLQPFRYWCQKVLPLVYDDSLSYYELLCKVVDYLNKTMEDVETLYDDVTNLHTAYEQLQNYVNMYFSSLDVQQEINNKLDELVLNGTLESLITKRVLCDTIYTHKIGSYLSISGGTPQGFCVHNKIAYECTLYPNDENNTLLVKRDITSGVVISTAKLGLGHANSMCYDEKNNVLIIFDSVVNRTAYYTVDPNTLSIINSYNTSGTVYGTVTWDRDNNEAVCIGLRNSRTIITAKVLDDFSLSEPEEGNTLPFDYGIQNAIIIGNYLVTFSGNNYVIVYDKTTLSIIRSCSIYNYADDLFWLGEIEQWCVDVDGTIYGNSGQYMGNYDGTQYGEWLVMHYTVGLFKPLSYTTIIAVKGRPSNFGTLYVTDNKDFNYLNSGYSGNPCYITEGINCNKNSGVIPQLTGNVESILFLNDCTLYGVGYNINKVICVDCNVSISRAKINELILVNSTFKTGEQSSVVSLNANNSIFNNYINVNNITASYSTITLNKCDGAISLTSSSISGDITKDYINEGAKRSTVYVVTSRGCYCVTRGNGTYLPLFKTVAYDTNLIVNNDNFKELNSSGQSVETTVTRVYCR